MNLQVGLAVKVQPAEEFDVAKHAEGPLPTVGIQNRCAVVTADTVARLLVDTRNSADDCSLNFLIVDCRFPYEYQHGHIASAVNLWTTPSLLDALLNEPLPSSFRIIFHCEFSSERGPELCTALRQQDRVRVIHQLTPDEVASQVDDSKLQYPFCYLMRGGYKDFFKKYPQLCTPQEYLTMKDSRYVAALKQCRKHRSQFRRSVSCSEISHFLTDGRGSPLLSPSPTFSPVLFSPKPPLGSGSGSGSGDFFPMAVPSLRGPETKPHHLMARWEMENANPLFCARGIAKRALPEMDEGIVHPVLRRAQAELRYALIHTPLASEGAQTLFEVAYSDSGGDITDSDDDEHSMSSFMSVSTSLLDGDPKRGRKRKQLRTSRSVIVSSTRTGLSELSKRTCPNGWSLSSSSNSGSVSVSESDSDDDDDDDDDQVARPATALGVYNPPRPSPLARNDSMGFGSPPLFAPPSMLSRSASLVSEAGFSQTPQPRTHRPSSRRAIDMTCVDSEDDE